MVEWFPGGGHQATCLVIMALIALGAERELRSYSVVKNVDQEKNRAQDNQVPTGDVAI